MIGISAAIVAIFAALSPLSAGASMADAGQPLPKVERFPAGGGLTHAEDGVILPDGRLLVGDWNHGLVTIAPDGTIAPFGDFAAAGFRTKPDPMWNSPNGVSWEPDGRHVLVADITGGHIYRVDTATQAVTRIYDHPFGVNAAIRDPSGAIWFTQSTKNAPGAASEARMFSAADKPMGDGSVWRIAPGEVGKVSPRAVGLVDGLDFANGIVFDGQRGRLYVAEIVASRILSFAVDPATGALTDRRVLARVTTPDNIELAADGMLWAASPFANAIYRINPDSGAVSTAFNPDPAKSARMVAELERRQAVGEPLLPLLSPELWAPMPGLVTGVILPLGDGPAYVSGLGDALVKIDVPAHADDAAATISALTDFARDYAKAWSSQNPERVAAFYRPNGRLTVNGGEPAIGPAAIADVARSFMEAFPDLVVAFDRLEPSGGRMLFHWTLTGTNTGPGGTGAQVRISGVEAWMVGPDGLIADSTGAFDAEDYARQLGAGSAGIALTAAQKDVWQGEIDYWERVNSRDIEGYLALWHPDFTGWPCGAPGPADLSGLAEFADGWFAGMAARGQRTVPTPEAVIVKDGFALTYLSAVTDWREADGQTTTKREKFVHTWQKTPEGWKIIGGMCAPLEAYDAAVTAAQASDTVLAAVLDNRTSVIIEGIRSGDVSGIMALYGPGSLYSSDNSTLLSSAEAIKAFWTQVAASPAHDATLEVLRIERLGPEAFVEIQKYEVFDAGGAQLFGGYASLLWRKIGGRWLIAADVSN